MSNWKEYKNTFNSSMDIFSLARSGEINKFKTFLKSNPEIDINHKNHKGHSPLMIAVYMGNHEVSEFLIEKGADPNSTDLSGNTVLMGAAFKGDVAMVQLLIKQGAQKDLRNPDGLTAEHWASAFGRTNVTSILRPNGNRPFIENILNAVKAIWGIRKTFFRKEVTA